ncbi:MAG: hypothetical protein ACYDA0_06430 [Candidatus Dormibacteraceae bacterium]
MLNEPTLLPEKVDGLITKREVILPVELVSNAEAMYADPVCTPVEVAACYGATPLLIREFLEQGTFDELLSVMSRYFFVVGPLQYRAWSLLEARQALQFHLSAARAENRLRTRLRQESSEADGANT